MAPKHHPTPLSGGDRKALQKELGRAMTGILAAQAAEARAKGEALIKQADRLLCESWNERMWANGDPDDGRRGRDLDESAGGRSAQAAAAASGRGVEDRRPRREGRPCAGDVTRHVRDRAFQHYAGTSSTRLLLDRTLRTFLTVFYTADAHTQRMLSVSTRNFLCDVSDDAEPCKRRILFRQLRQPSGLTCCPDIVGGEHRR